MQKKLFLWILIVLIFISGCGVKEGALPKNPAEKEKEIPQEDNVDPLKRQIDKMTLVEKIGQMVIVGLEDGEMDDNAQEMIEKYKVGGFILFKRNIKDTKQTLNLLNSLKEANAKNTFPLFLAVDEEGGRVTRMPDEFMKLPPNRIIGKINNEDFSYEIGSVIGEQLNSLGFNLDFAPVLDIDSNPKNPVIGDRAFGSNESIVSKLGIQTMKGIKSHVISAVKHFPGHGDTSVDSHVGLPGVDYDLDRLKKFELVPFAKAIEEGADMVMVAHILLTQIDKENPATLSKTIITDILRGDLGFDGVVITDDMTMGAIIERYDIADAAVKSVMAGSDIILVCHDYTKQAKVIDAINSAVEDGVISEDVIDKSVYRILTLKEKYKLKDEKIESVDVEGINERIRDILSRYYHQ